MLTFTNEVMAQTGGPSYESVEVRKSGREDAAKMIGLIASQGNAVVIKLASRRGSHVVTALRGQGDLMQLQSNEQVGWATTAGLGRGNAPQWCLQPNLTGYLRPLEVAFENHQHGP